MYVHEVIHPRLDALLVRLDSRSAREPLNVYMSRTSATIAALQLK